MLQSMTGFGEAQFDGEGLSFLVEIKTLNNRFLKINTKIPDQVSFAEPEVEKLVREKLARGSVTFILHLRHTDTSGPFTVNQAALQHYLRSLEQVLTLTRKNDGVHIDLANLLMLPGICQTREYSHEEHEHFLKIIHDLTIEALDRLHAMRREEGQNLQMDLMKNCNAIQKNLDELKAMTDQVLESYRQRIESRVNELLNGAKLKLDADMLAKEVALFAERSDISEEVARLGSHLGQFEDVCEHEEQAGRRLEFLAQEMLREANTIGSKANSAAISQRVVDIKVAIDRIREQVQNVE